MSQPLHDEDIVIDTSTFYESRLLNTGDVLHERFNIVDKEFGKNMVRYINREIGRWLVTLKKGAL